MKNYYWITFLSGVLACCHPSEKSSKSLSSFNAYEYKIQKRIECANGAVVSAHPLASKVGVDILKMGGNAFDAAIATQLALAVVYPGAGNLGGGGFLVVERNRESW